MRLNGHGGHHGDNVQKKNYVADEGVGGLMPKVNFDVCPHELRQQPHSQSQAHERPEKTGLSRGSFQVGENCDGGAQQYGILQDVAEGGEGEPARRKKR